jgi:hypothetical protein
VGDRVAEGLQFLIGYPEFGRAATDTLLELFPDPPPSPPQPPGTPEFRLLTGYFEAFAGTGGNAQRNVFGWVARQHV